jgi:methylmalonyl-CoA mutase N-terminal domain/subunit
LRFTPINVSGTHIRESGANPAQEIAYVTLNALAYIEETLKRGYDIDQVAPFFAFHLCAHGRDFFEDIAKLRAARRLWSKILKERFGAQNPRSYRLRISTGGGGSYLSKKQMKNNITRITLCALAAVLGGSQSLNLGSYDEALAIPTEEAARTTLMVQQILAHESGIANTADPLGGSYFVETLTGQVEEKAREEMERIERSGGILKAIEDGKIQRTLAEQAYIFEKKLRNGEVPWIGVNRQVIDEEEEEDVEIHEMDPDTRDRQVRSLEMVKGKRSGQSVAKSLNELRKVAQREENLMPAILKAVRSYASMGEIVAALKETYGTFQEPTF